MKSCFVMAALAMMLLVAPASGDEILLKNGERIIGKITGMEGGRIKVTSDSMGATSVGLDDIVTFSTDEPIELHFADDSIMNSKVNTHTEGQVQIPVGADQELNQFNVADIKKINPPKVKWTGSIALGAWATRGNTYTQGANGSLNAVRRTELDRITFDAGYVAGRQRDTTTREIDTTQRKSYAGLQYDYFFTKKAYAYANLRAERDAIADIDVRLLAGAGAGYQFIESDPINYSGELGLSWISENRYAPAKDEDYLSARIAHNLTGKLNNGVSYFHHAAWYPGFEHEGGHYVTTESGLRASLLADMFAEFKMLWDWDSTPAQGKKRIDVTYLLSLGWSF